jgi:hypothetical protein
MATPISDRVQAALDESRILVLGAEVLLGFEYRAAFEARFAALPGWSKAAKLGGLLAMLIAFCLIVAPAAYHRIVSGGEDTEDLNRFTSGVLAFALAFFAAALGVDAAVAVERVFGTPAALAAGLAAAAATAAVWYGYTYAARARHARRPQEQSMPATETTVKVRQVLTESRVLLPGAQALLGFQFAVTLMETFDDLPRSLRVVHLASLGAIALTVVILITPAAYHRIVERGEATEHFHRVASRLVLAAMVPLGVGLCLDLLIVAHRVTGSLAASALLAAGVAAFVFAMWFGLTLAIRNRRAARPPGRRLEPAAQRP